MQWLTIGVSTFLGALLAGGYGAIQGQFTYTLSPEYFTALKFPQLGIGEVTLPPRAKVACIGFTGAWWLGAAVGLLFSRIVIIDSSNPGGCRRFLIACGVILTTTLIAGLSEGFIYHFRSAEAIATELRNWSEYQLIYNLTDLEAFVRVAGIHRASYFGAAAGVILGLGYLIAALWRRGIKA